MGVKISMLDRSPILENETATEALHNTVRLAQKAEELGYHRFWVSEHHDSAAVVGSSPEVLIAYLLANTSRIRIGSGGVMLQHYSPFKVAENFNVLSALAPGRVDLGIGRAPGGLPRSTRALQQDGTHGGRSLDEKLVELIHHLHHTLPEEHPLYGVTAVPLADQPADVYLLGTSPSSAALAASLGLPYVFAQFLNGDDGVMDEALHVYRTQFSSVNGSRPQAVVALSVLVADTEEEAKALAADSRVYKLHLESGTTINLGSLEAVEEYGKQAKEKFSVETRQASIIHGTQESVRKQVADIQERYRLEEIIFIVAEKSLANRLRAYERLHDAFAEWAVQPAAQEHSLT